ncbi:DUF418 domain-containing protein [Leptospira semungkisensis]|uniref:DUF418 domain-containing protein n=1 Tax=Leptospira semungkisensis TaxID=2484985 RepID=A0A4R9G8D3_9LEPT|nr:DUF418 domain-containing protein [Leptospira semungkisensis]TGK07926.1 DUF418 domain-containing protein [Leptospira semungkisensis]
MITHKRIGFIDFLRGFALFGILVVNLPYFSKPMFLVASLHENSTLLDSIGSWIVAFFFESKFYVLFSFLFGYGFSMQMDSSESSKANFEYFRRIFALIILGILHGIFLFLGDILFSYGILGIALWFLRKKSPIWLLRFSFLCLLLAIAGRIVLFAAEDSFRAFLANHLTQILEETRKAYLGSFWENAIQRSKETFSSFRFLVLYQWPSILAMFSLGLAAAKKSIFADWGEARLFLSKYFPWMLILGVLGNLLYTLHSRHVFPEDLNKSLKFFLVCLDPISAPALTFCYVYILGNYYASSKSLADKPWFETAGRLSLTSYLGESLVCTWIFCGWGLGYFDQLGSYIVLLLSVPIWIFWVGFSALWDRFFSLGPMEWLLRSWTYWSFMKLKRPGS